jgi:hypothetical protein
MDNYVITGDLVEVLIYKYGVKEVAQIPELASEISQLEADFINSYAKVIPSRFQIVTLAAKGLIERIEEEVRKVEEASPNTFILGLDKVYLRNRDLYLEVTREVDPSTGAKISKITNRFGTPPREDQFRTVELALSARDGKKDGVVLVDVGVFDGETLKTVIEEMSKYDIPLKGIILGISKYGGKENLEKSFGDRVKVIRPIDFTEWIELRDLFLIDGRKVPEEYTRDNVRRFVPYTENLVEWASIDKGRVDDAKKVCLQFNEKLGGLLAKYNVYIRSFGEFIPIGQKVNPKRTEIFCH